MQHLSSPVSYPSFCPSDFQMGHFRCMSDIIDISVLFRNSLHERGRNITDHHSVSLFKDICFLSLDSTSGAYGGNVLSR